MSALTSLASALPHYRAPEARPRPIWAAIGDDDPNARFINDGDSYIVELDNGDQVWAVYSRDGGFVDCDDEGNEIARSGFSCPMPLDNVRRVMIRGHLAGYGPSCPKAGEPMKIGLVVVQPLRLAEAMAAE